MSQNHCKKLIFINRYYAPDNSATSQILTDVAKALSASYDVEIICSRYSYDSLSSYDGFEILDSVTVHRVFSTNFGRHNSFLRMFDYMSFGLATFFKARKICHKNSIVVAKTDPPLLIVLLALVKKINGFYLVSWNQDIFPEVAKDLFFSQKVPRLGLKKLTSKLLSQLYYFLYWLRNKSWQMVDKHVVISHSMVDYVNDVCIKNIKNNQSGQSIQAKTKHLNLITNHAKGRIDGPIENHQEVHQMRLGLLPKNYHNALIIAYSGNLGHVHDWQTMAQVILSLKERQDLFFVIQGGGKHYHSLQKFAHKHSISNICFTNYCSLERLPIFMAMADIHWLSLSPVMKNYVFPSKFASLCAAQKPVLYIGDINDEISQLMLEYDMHSFFNIGNYEAIAQWLIDVKNNRDKLEYSSTQANKLYQDCYSLTSTTQSWFQLVDDILTERDNENNT